MHKEALLYCQLFFQSEFELGTLSLLVLAVWLLAVPSSERNYQTTRGVSST